LSQEPGHAQYTYFGGSWLLNYSQLVEPVIRTCFA
jgi:hypothetical protein